jgi:Asp/Glu/hydantoin racemase
MAAPRIVLLHATPVAMEPIHVAFRQRWPEAELVNLLDDALTIDRAKEDRLSEPMTERFVRLCRYGRDIGAEGVLATCSAFGPAIEQAAGVLGIPVLKPNEAMFEAAVGMGDRIGMIATFPPALITMEQEFVDETRRLASGAKLSSIVIPDAMAALRRGDVDRHNQLIAARAQEFEGFDAIMLAHFSTSRAAPALRAVSAAPVLTAPEAAVDKMRRLVLSRNEDQARGQPCA